jgi:hypothetical protein
MFLKPLDHQRSSSITDASLKSVVVIVEQIIAFLDLNSRWVVGNSVKVVPYLCHFDLYCSPQRRGLGYYGNKFLFVVIPALYKVALSNKCTEGFKNM